MIAPASRHPRIFHSVVSVSLPTTVIEMVDRIAHERGQRRSELIRQLIVQTLGTPEDSSEREHQQESA